MIKPNNNRKTAEKIYTSLISNDCKFFTSTPDEHLFAIQWAWDYTKGEIDLHGDDMIEIIERWLENKAMPVESMVEPSPSVKHVINFDECRVADWNGYGADPITDEALFRGVQLLMAIKQRYIIRGYRYKLSFPDFAPEPSGEATLAWQKNGYYIIVGLDDDLLVSWGGKTPTGHTMGSFLLYEEEAGLTKMSDLIDVLHAMESTKPTTIEECNCGENQSEAVCKVNVRAANPTSENCSCTTGQYCSTCTPSISAANATS